MTRHLTRTLMLACLCLALAATAAQARLLPSEHRDSGFNTTPTHTAPARPVTVVATKKATFGYSDAAIGAAVVVALVGIGVIALRRPRPQLVR